MEQFTPIDIHQAYQKLQHQEAILVDIRDPQSYAQGHIKGSYHLTDGSLNQLIANVGYEKPLIVMCYHGISSMNAAQYLLHQGFAQVYNLEGGFAAWAKELPIEVSVEQ